MPAQQRVLPEGGSERQVTGQYAVSRLAVRDRHAMGTLAVKRWDGSRCFAVAPGCVRPGSDLSRPQAAAGCGERLDDVCGIVACHHPAALDALAVEPGDATGEEADQRWLLLICQHLARSVRWLSQVDGQSRGVIADDMDHVEANLIGAALLAMARDLPLHSATVGQGLDVDGDLVDQSLLRWTLETLQSD